MKRTLRSATRIAVFILVAHVVCFSQTRWVGSWATSQQIAEPHNSIPAEELRDLTLRQIVRLTLGGPQVRVRISNRYGVAPLRFTTVHIARPVSPASAAIVPGTDKVVTFAGATDVTVPNGSDYISDPVAFPVTALSDLAITMHLETVPTQQTGHPGSRATSYLAHGDVVAAESLPDAKTINHWYFIAGVDVPATSQAGAVVVFGDSITDGYGTTTNGNDRWPDHLAKRFQASAPTQSLSVLNHGIGGNHLLTDGLGPNALARFPHDALLQPGVRTIIVFEGVNDLGGLTRLGEVSEAEHKNLVHRMIASYEQMIARAHANGIKIIGATITPFVGSDYYHPGPATEADRQAVNEWIRKPGNFDGVIDFDSVVRDPQRPERLLPTFDCGDHLHPSLAGYAAMANAVPLDLLQPAAAPQTGLVSKIAFTFDDIPAHGSLPPGQTRIGVANSIITALRDAKVPSTYAFLNGQLLKQQPADANVLQAWMASGNKLGNHGWSHMNLNQHTVPEFETEIQQNEPLLKEHMKKADWRWLRYPFLARGETPEKREAFRAYLQKNGYKIAGVTMSFADYLYTEPYARCSAKGDTKAIELLEQTYLAAAEEDIEYRRELSRRALGRDIPYVLLMHLGAFNARMLPRLLDLYRSKGFQFVTLEQAESDPFYKTEVKPGLPAAPDNLEGAAAQANVPIPPRLFAAPQFDSLCR